MNQPIIQILGSAINNVHEDCPDEQLTIGTRSADLAEEFAEALAARVEHFVRMLCNKVRFFLITCCFLFVRLLLFCLLLFCLLLFVCCFLLMVFALLLSCRWYAAVLG